MKRTIGAVLLILASLFIGANVSAGGRHEPITILGNRDFTEENGVVSGSGTAEDPYIIAGWEIDVPSGARYGIKIENTTAHVIFRGLILRGAMDAEGAAIHLGFTSNTTIEDTTVANSLHGIEIICSRDITLKRNVLYVSGRGLRVTGESPEEYRHTIDETNLLNNYPVTYLYGKKKETVSAVRSTHLTLAACENMTITNNEIINGDGIQLAFVKDSEISNNVVNRTSPVPTEHGISLYRSSGNTIRDNELTNNRRAGVYLWLSTQNDIADNELLANDYGAILAASDNNLVRENVVFANPTGIEISAGSTGNEVTSNIITHKNTKYGIAVEKAAANRLERNAIVECETGIMLDAQGNNNTVMRNTIVGGAHGLSITGSYNEIAHNLIAHNSRGVLFSETFGKQKARGNALYDNLFSKNAHHIYLNLDSAENRLYRNVFLGKATSLVSDHGKNIWSVLGEGNFWEDYAGSDANGDGMGDVPVRVYPAGAEDSFPLIFPSTARGALGVLTTLEETTLVLDTKKENKVEIPALIADENIERFVGFRGFPELLLADFSGILFDYKEEVSGGLTGTAFTMSTVSFPLDIAFFDGGGAFVGSETMEANSSKRYTVEGQFRFALELASGRLAEHDIGAGTRLLFPGED